jgi:hypothetical protein
VEGRIDEEGEDSSGQSSKRERPGEVKRKREKAVREKTCRAGTVSI